MMPLAAYELASKTPPSMMGADELLYLHWLAQEIYTGAGEIIDAGCLRGASTICLAAGLRNNRDCAGGGARIHSYDLFEYQDHYMAKLFPGQTLRSGDSFLPLFLAQISDFHDLVEVIPGDITGKQWKGRPIELLFLDVVKSSAINTHVLREFFSCLIPERSIVIQQDYFHFYCYWIHLTMAHLADYFQVFPSPRGGTLAFRLLKPIPRELLDMDYARDFSLPEKTRLMDAAVAAHEGVNRLHILTAKAAMLGDGGDWSGACALAEAVYHSPEWRTGPLLGELSGLIRWLRSRSQGAGLSSTLRLIEAWDARMNGQAALRLSELRQVTASRAVYIWGAGPTGNQVLQAARNEKIAVDGFLDRDPTLAGTLTDGLTVRPPGLIAEPEATRRPYVLIGSKRVREIALQLETWGYRYGSDYSF